MIYWQRDKSQHKHQITGTSKTCRFGLFCAAVGASGAAAVATGAAAAAAGCAGFEQGAYCQKYDSGQYGQYDNITHDRYLLRDYILSTAKPFKVSPCLGW